MNTKLMRAVQCLAAGLLVTWATTKPVHAVIDSEVATFSHQCCCPQDQCTLNAHDEQVPDWASPDFQCDPGGGCKNPPPNVPNRTLHIPATTLTRGKYDEKITSHYEADTAHNGFSICVGAAGGQVQTCFKTPLTFTDSSIEYTRTGDCDN